MSETTQKANKASNPGNTAALPISSDGFDLVPGEQDRATHQVNSANGSNGAIYASRFQIDLARANRTWGTTHTTLTDVFSTITQVSNGPVISAPTHMLGLAAKDLRLIPYNDEFGVLQNAIASVIPPGAIAISMKHHCHRPEPAERIKLQVTHIQVAVGIQKDGKAGVCTINNPQGYQGGLFGEPDYPMILVRPKLPQGLTPDEQKAYIDNIRTWAVIANSFTVFPNNYDGGDPLGNRSVTRVQAFGNRLLGALCGSSEDKEWLSKPQNRLYCAELAYTALNLGLYAPINAQYLGASRFENVKAHLASKEFLNTNGNPWIRLVDLSVSPEALVPINTRLPIEATEPSNTDPFGNGLAIEPFTFADILEAFIERTYPRKTMGEHLAEVQLAALKESWPLIATSLGLDAMPVSDPRRQEAELVFNQVLRAVGTQYANYQEFRAALNPLLENAGRISRPDLETGIGAFIPPHCFLVRATDSISGQPSKAVLTWEYVGHGIHESLLVRVRPEDNQ